MTKKLDGSTVVTLVPGTGNKNLDQRLKETMEELQKKTQHIVELRERLGRVARDQDKDRTEAWMITGPSCTAIVISKCRIDVLINALCNTNGDRTENYACKKVTITIKGNK